VQWRERWCRTSSSNKQQQQQQQQVEKLNLALQQQLNLEAVKTRAISLFKAITRILEDFDAYARTNTTPKWSFPCSSFLFFFTHNAHDLPAVWRVAQT
jgi:hypothetical protein